LALTHPASNPKHKVLCGSARIANASALYPRSKETRFYGYFDNKQYVQSYQLADLIKPDEEDPEKLLLFLSDGTVAIRLNLAPGDQHRAKETIRVFNLNAASLINQRRQAVQGYLSIIEEQSVLSNAEWREYIAEELQGAAEQAFVTAIRHILM
jgi:hypothetical protein